MTRLIYHTEENYGGGESPFDRAIRETADSEEVWIICPYIGPSYVKDYSSRFVPKSDGNFGTTAVDNKQSQRSR